jgi:hypothetical protein
MLCMHNQLGSWPLRCILAHLSTACDHPLPPLSFTAPQESPNKKCQLVYQCDDGNLVSERASSTLVHPDLCHTMHLAHQGTSC